MPEPVTPHQDGGHPAVAGSDMGRPSRGRLVAIALLGPLVGTLVIFLAPFIIDPPGSNLVGGIETVIVLFVFGYVFGILPSSLAAVIYGRLAPKLIGFWWKLSGCLVIGALCGMLAVLVPILILAREFAFASSLMLLSGMAGAFALPITALASSKAAPVNLPDRPFPRSTVIIAFGPVVGAIAMFIAVFPMSQPWADPEPWDFLWRGAVLYLVVGWAAGLLPAIASALVWRFAISEAWSFRRRAVAAVLIGFVAGTFLIRPFMVIFFGPYAPDFGFNLVAGLCGAIALCATALPGGRR